MSWHADTSRNNVHSHSITQYVDMSTCRMLQNVDILSSIFPTHPCLNVRPVDLSSTSESRHIDQYVPYPPMIQYVNLLTCHLLQ